MGCEIGGVHCTSTVVDESMWLCQTVSSCVTCAIAVVTLVIYIFYLYRGKAARGEKAFRESFARLAELRSIVKQGEYGIMRSVIIDFSDQSEEKSTIA